MRKYLQPRKYMVGLQQYAKKCFAIWKTHIAIYLVISYISYLYFSLLLSSIHDFNSDLTTIAKQTATGNLKGFFLKCKYYHYDTYTYLS